MEPTRTVREEFMSAFGDQVTVSGGATRGATAVAVRTCCWEALLGGLLRFLPMQQPDRALLACPRHRFSHSSGSGSR